MQQLGLEGAAMLEQFLGVSDEKGLLIFIFILPGFVQGDFVKALLLAKDLLGIIFSRVLKQILV